MSAPSIFPTSVPADFSAMLSWFTNVNAMALRMRQLEARIEELEHLYGGSSLPMPTRVVHAHSQLAVQPAAPHAATNTSTTTNNTNTTKTSNKKNKKSEKKERKPRRVRTITKFLNTGETLVARIPIGNRMFEEVEVVYENDTFTVMGQDISNTNLNKVVQLIAKTLEDEGIRDKECKSPLNAWLLCSVMRHGKRVVLEKLSDMQTAEEQVEEQEGESGDEAAAEESTEESTEEQ